jgi:hypothetical protein
MGQNLTSAQMQHRICLVICLYFPCFHIQPHTSTIRTTDFSESANILKLSSPHFVLPNSFVMNNTRLSLSANLRGAIQNGAVVSTARCNTLHCFVVECRQ